MNSFRRSKKAKRKPKEKKEEKKESIQPMLPVNEYCTSAVILSTTPYYLYTPTAILRAELFSTGCDKGRRTWDELGSTRARNKVDVTVRDAQPLNVSILFEFRSMISPSTRTFSYFSHSVLVQPETNLLIL